MQIYNYPYFNFNRAGRYATAGKMPDCILLCSTADSSRRLAAPPPPCMRNPRQGSCVCRDVLSNVWLPRHFVALESAFCKCSISLSMRESSSSSAALLSSQIFFIVIRTHMLLKQLSLKLVK